MSSVKALRQAGDRAVLIELDGNDAVQQLASGLEALRGNELEEIIPGHETLLLVWPTAAPTQGSIEAMIAAADAGGEETSPAGEV